MRLASKLLVAPIIAASVALAAIGVNAWLSQQQSAGLQALSATTLATTKTGAQVLEQLGILHAGAYRIVSIIESVEEAELKAFSKKLADQVAGIRSTMDAAVAAAGANPEVLAAWQKLSPELDNYGKQVKKALEMGSVDRNMGTAQMNGAQATFAGASKGLRELEHQLEAAQAQAVSALATRHQQWLVAVAALGLFITLVTLMWAWRVQRSVARAINQAVEVSREVASGKLTVEVTTHRRDELGDLLRALQTMTEQLRNTVQTVKTTAASIGSASVEIASGNMDLSQRTEQTASSLQQTSSSMSELTGTVRQSADAAAQASQLANSAASVAQRGGDVVQQVVHTMQEINNSSRKIGDIIATIDGIAFQTNILALNAAVEAARAGEQGRGFAVVAGEVRSLAGRSAEAAREIKRLVTVSVEKVESGSRLVNDAGTTMGEIVASVQRVNDIIAEIAAAASEQRQGIERVNSAVSQLDQMTQQNAALVEESAAAAESLKSQAATLGQVVNGFQLESTSSTSVAPSPSGAATPQALAMQVVSKARAVAAAKPMATAPTAPAKPVAATTAASGANPDDWETF